MKKDSFPGTQPGSYTIEGDMSLLQKGNSPALSQKVIKDILHLIRGLASKDARNFDKDFESFFGDNDIVPKDVRKKNIELVNAYQDNLLIKSGYQLSINAADREKRRLVVYYRSRQATTYYNWHIRKLMYLLRKYVEGGYSHLFDTFNVVYRYNDIDYLPEFSKNSLYLSVQSGFEELTSIYANTLHFYKGTPAFFPGTLPILTTGPIHQNKDILHGHEYVELDILNTVVDNFPDCSGNYGFTETMHRDYEKRLFASVLECERKMIHQAQG